MSTKIYDVKNTYSSDQIYTVEKGKFYDGKNTYSSDEIKSIALSGINIVDFKKVYKGKSNYSSDQIMTIENEKVYKGKNTYSSDQIATIQGDRLTDNELEKIIYLLAQRNHLI